MPALKKKIKKFPVEIKWLNSAWVAYQIKTSPAPLAYSSTPSSYVLWQPCCSSVITEGRCSAYKHPDHPLRKVNPQKGSGTASSNGTPAGMTDLPPHTDSITVFHFSSLTGTPLRKSSPQSNPVLMAVPSERTLAQQRTLGGKWN